jgi:hypothetical protein
LKLDKRFFGDYRYYSSMSPLTSGMSASIIKRQTATKPMNLKASIMSFKSFLAEEFQRPDNSLRSEPGYLYHATSEENLEDIKSSGWLDIFGPGYGTDQEVWPDGGEEERSYWTDRASSAWMFAPEHGRPVILRTLNSPNFKRESTGDYYSTARIPSSRLQVLMRDGTWVNLV